MSAASVRCLGRRASGFGLAWAALLASAAVANAQEQPRNFDEATVAAWKKAGAEVGWMGNNKFGYQEFREQPAGLIAAAPAFRFKSWQEGRLAKLPDPALPFGLDLRETKVTDAGLKELAGLQSLQTLNLYNTRVTDAGVAMLQKALPRCRIERQS